MNSFRQLQKTWTRLGEKDPFWAILTNPEYKDGNWSVDPFFISGELEIQAILAEIKGFGHSLTTHRALDFGCGVGRLSQALSQHFDQVYGVDVAASMIRLANQFKKPLQPITYCLNTQANLGLFEKDYFDFVYSRLVLQHIPPVYSQQYVKEFIRVLKPGGLAAFQVPISLQLSADDQAMIQPFLKPSVLFQAELATPTQSLQLATREKKELVVKICHKGSVAWDSTNYASIGMGFKLGNHWLNEQGRMVQLDDGRMSLPAVVYPHQEITTTLPITAPVYPGSYLLELDLVQEQVAWFSDKGNLTLQIPVQVTGQPPVKMATPSPSATHRVRNRFQKWWNRILPPPVQPSFEMYGVPASQLIPLIHQNGADLLAIQQDSSAHRDWISYFYFVYKRGS